ncbi:dUTP diphosphatase [Bacillus sp. FJAT-45037]|uniref:dUTP diphosphatase n=1 Tax=Bacillus sp. FJAT-45037 TaxID=2011007 RepID=UPI000C2497FB|nr:dUTP diphosphatase [Bacillus sp. FJAT-45037]
MNVQLLFETQKRLNERILNEHKVVNHQLFVEQQLAFLVELGELANETRCFKYWSTKGPSKKAIILEEYVDGLHFVLTLGLSLGWSTLGNKNKSQDELSVTDQFLTIMKETLLLTENREEEQFHKLCGSFLSLGEKLGFSEAEIEKAYFEKNEVNHQRQDNGY